MMISADLLRGYTDAVILRRLTGEDGYGYQISKEVANIRLLCFARYHDRFPVP